MQPIDFRGFKFGNVHSSDLNLEVVSTSNRYEARTLPAPTDTVQDVPGSDGQYYFGSVYKNREITVNVAFDNVTEQIYRKIKQLFATDKLQDLVFDEEPYKTWKAKLKSKPEFKSLCFNDDEGNRIYKGDGKLQFICYFPYAFGFDKYVIKAADYYLLNTPEQILCELSNDDDFYFASRELPAPAWIPADLRYHYNVNPKNRENSGDISNKGDRQWDPNDGIAWKTGFPTIDQVQNGELYFDLNGSTKTLITTRGYWDNIPEWQTTAKLLTTPTLDFEQELMYMPQYSKTNYINMEIGFDSARPLIGTRLLVYNPGDLPIDWQLKIDENKRSFWSGRGSEKFRIRRFNVERLTIPQAVDWCGMKTYEASDNEPFKYGDKYFKRKKFDVQRIIDNILEAHDDNQDVEFSDSSGDRNGGIKTDQLIQQIKSGYLPADKDWGMSFKVEFTYYDIGNNEEGTIIYTCLNADLPYYIYEQISRYEFDHVYDFRDPNTGIWSRTELSPSMLETYVNIKDYNREGPQIAFDLGYPAPSEEFKNEWCYDDFTHFYIRTNLYQLRSFIITAIGDQADFNYPYESQTSAPITAKDDERIRKLSETQEVTNYRPQSPTIAYNLHLRTKYIGNQMFDSEGPFTYEELGEAHPTHCYFAEPIPRQKLGDYIRLFYWQSKQLSEGELTYKNTSLEAFANWVNNNFYMNTDIDFNKGHFLADRYEEVLKQCTSEEEEFELYWDTLRELFNDFVPLADGASSEKLFYNYVNCPLEYIPCDSRDLDYGQEVFNAFKYPSWMTPDYLEIDVSKLSNIPLIERYMAAIGLDTKSLFNGQIIYYDRSKLTTADQQDLRLKLDKLLGDGGRINDLIDNCYYLNSDTHMLYALEEPKGSEFNYKPNKIVMNEAITKGKWFKIPPGWSMIAIEPVMDESLYGGKRWIDARPFDWGYGGDRNNNQKEVSQLFDLVYDYADSHFRDIYYSELNNALPQEERDSYWETPFNKWYESKIYGNDNLFMVEYYYHQRYRAEQEFLSIIDDFWNMISPYYAWTARKGVYQQADRDKAAENGQLYLDAKFDVDGIPIHSITGHISDWWWYSVNYLWGNFPPIYWTTADMLNNMKIEYTPLFY